MWETYLGNCIFDDYFFIKKQKYFIGSLVKCIAANRKLIIACCEDFTINCFLVKSGARAWPLLLIEDLAVSLCVNDESICLVLTKTGLVHMWNFENGKSILNRVSLRSLLSNKGKRYVFVQNLTCDVVKLDKFLDHSASSRIEF